VVGVWGPPLLVHALAETTPAGNTHPMPEKGLFAIAVAVGVALWAVGAWQVFDSNTTLGALLVLAGAVIVIARPRAVRCEYTPTALRNWPVVR
jgi:hypothetical protein